MRGVRDLFVLLVVLVLQATLLYRIEIAGIRPDLLVAFVVYLAWMRGPVTGTIAGFGVGLLQDLDAPGPLGLNAFSKSLVAFLVAKAGFRVHRSNLGVRFAFFFLAMLAHDIVYFAVATGGELRAFLVQMLTVALPSALYTTVVVLLLLAIVESMGKRSLLTDEA
ncbi:MAG TPA: rod shape-determining protein MreD [Candidatus Eisenbacteria bacterium]|nr:rod shape-determining protein MreD [Candidatus Eisenbacteria bacterium]